MSDAASRLVAYVGCYTTADRRGRGQGLRAYRALGEGWRPLWEVSAVNPSYLTYDRSERFLYVAHGATDFVSAYELQGERPPLYLGQFPAEGRNPVHLSVDPSNRWLIGANYTSGELVVWPILAHGGLGAPSQIVPVSGRPGPHPSEQAGPHPHHIPFDRTGRFVFMADKGLDEVRVYAFDPRRGELDLVTTAASKPGAGPRHLVEHPELSLIYVANELDSTVAVYSWDGGARLTPGDVVSTLPAGETCKNSASEILLSPDAMTLLVSNRGHDSVVAYRVDAATGALSPSSWTPCGGAWPRVMAFDPAGRHLHVANQDGDCIVEFAFDDGALRPTGRIVETGSPACILFGEARAA